MFDTKRAGRSPDNVEPETLNLSPRMAAQERMSDPATIGSSIVIKGELSGEEDLIVQGTVEGSIILKKNKLTIGKDGAVNANVQAHTVVVEGTLKGDVIGEEKVVIEKTGSVHGNVSAPRVSLADGAKFKGSMDMDAKRPVQMGDRGGDVVSSMHVMHDHKPVPVKKSALEPQGA